MGEREKGSKGWGKRKRVKGTGKDGEGKKGMGGDE